MAKEFRKKDVKTIEKVVEKAVKKAMSGRIVEDAVEKAMVKAGAPKVEVILPSAKEGARKTPAKKAPAKKGVAKKAPAKKTVYRDSGVRHVKRSSKTVEFISPPRRGPGPGH